MTQPTADQSQMAQEVLAGTREISGSSAVSEPPAPQNLPEATQQQLYDIKGALAPHMEQVAASGETRTAEPIPELENKQWAFERGEVAQDIQRVNDMKAPGE